MKEIDRPQMNIVTYRNNAYETLHSDLGYIMLREQIERLGVEIALTMWDNEAREDRTQW